MSKARLSGRLVLHPDGSIDAGKSDRRRASTTDPSQQRGRPAALRPVPQAAVGAVAETLREQGLPSPEGKIDFVAARTANEVLKARLRRMELQQKEGELVDRARTTALVFRLARQERDAWLGCATGRTDGASCPPVVTYSRDFLARAAGELASLPAGSAIEQMLADYQVMRDQARACAR